MEENSRNMLPSPPPDSQDSFLTEDLLAEILSRVPYSSLCRFKCVSKSWLALCSDPAIRRRSPQTLTGFFYRLVTSGRQALQYRHQFTNLSGRGRPMLDRCFTFMPPCKRIEIINSSNGLLLCRCVEMSPEHEYDYVVCNPAIEKWILLPYTEAMEGLHTVRLGFDPAASSHFTVFLLAKKVQEPYCQVTGVEIYSSKTGSWTYRQSEWGDDCTVHDAAKSVFFNGIMHFTTAGSSVATVDMELKRWRKIPTPRCTLSSFIGLSQGSLYLLHNIEYRDDQDISVWALKDYGGDQWILKHSVSESELFGGLLEKEELFTGRQFRFLTAVHPERNLFFFTMRYGNVASYDMDSRTMHTIFTPGRAYAYQPYVPCFAEWLSDGR